MPRPSLALDATPLLDTLATMDRDLPPGEVGALDRLTRALDAYRAARERELDTRADEALVEWASAALVRACDLWQQSAGWQVANG